MNVLYVAAEDRSCSSALEVLGIPYREIQPNQWQEVDLDTYSNVILDVRLLGSSEEFRHQVAQLQPYMKKGGHVLCLYHKTFEWNDFQDAGLTPAPYPLKVSRSRVCEEQAKVSLLQPDHPLLCWPHRLSQADFDDWVQERGLYFPHESFDERYVTLLSCHDQGEEPLPGGLLFTRFGAGTFTYCAYALHRQLRAGHQGGMRLFVNLLATAAPPKGMEAVP
jgi:hypothetical protein